MLSLIEISEAMQKEKEERSEIDYSQEVVRRPFSILENYKEV